jgi:hypothetical protein
MECSVHMVQGGRNQLTTHLFNLLNRNNAHSCSVIPTRGEGTGSRVWNSLAALHIQEDSFETRKKRTLRQRTTQRRRSWTINPLPRRICVSCERDSLAHASLAHHCKNFNRHCRIAIFCQYSQMKSAEVVNYSTGAEISTTLEISRGYNETLLMPFSPVH